MPIFFNTNKKRKYPNFVELKKLEINEVVQNYF